MNVATLSSLSLVDLKQLAKGRRIKQYYIMKRHQLIQLLALPELPESLRLEKLTIQELRDQAKAKGLRGFWNLHREDLLAVLYPHSRGSQQEHHDSQEHQSPQERYGNQVGCQPV